MGKARAFPIKHCDFRRHRRLLIDTNVWIYLNGPQVWDNPEKREYSEALKKIRQAKCDVFIDVVVLSEFMNRYLRIKFEAWKPDKSAEFKDFRSSTDYPAVAKDVADAVRGILRTCQLVDSGFESIDMEALLADFEEGRRDFNDQILAELCKTKDLTLITHDSDFKGYGITALTANQKMIKADDESPS